MADKERFTVYGKGRYAYGGHQQWTNPQSGNLVRAIQEDPMHPIPVGRAYAFFDCQASPEAIEAALPKARDYAETPSELELELTENSETLDDAECRAAIESAKKYSLMRRPEDRREGISVSYRYALQATLPNATNKSAANKLNNIMNLLYGNELYPEQEEFFGEIVYKEDGKYVSN